MWLISCRYSDFLNLHDQVCLKYDQLSALNFPAKKAFGNMDKKVLETRREMFDDYLKALIRHITTEAHYDLMPILQWFLDQVIITIFWGAFILLALKTFSIS